MGEVGLEEVLEPRRKMVFERDSRAERATERMLLESEASTGAEVGPRAVVSAVFVDMVKVRLACEDESREDSMPFVFVKERDEEAADVGDRSSGVDDKVPLSPLVSGIVLGVEICEGTGVDGLLYIGAGVKGSLLRYGGVTDCRRKVS